MLVRTVSSTLYTGSLEHGFCPFVWINLYCTYMLDRASDPFYSSRKHGAQKHYTAAPLDRHKVSVPSHLLVASARSGEQRWSACMQSSVS
jgi:hypothetical protein